MKKSSIIWSCLLLISVALCGCGKSANPAVQTVETDIDMTSEINQMESTAAEEKESISVATTLDESGELTDFIDVSVTDTYVEKGTLTKPSLDYLKAVQGAYIDEKGNLLDGRSFVGVKLNIRSEKNLEIYTTSIVLRGVKGNNYSIASCFYHDGKRISTNGHDDGIAEIQAGTTELTVGFFADEEMMKSEKFYLDMKFFETDEQQKNYIEIILNEGNER